MVPVPNQSSKLTRGRRSNPPFLDANKSHIISKSNPNIRIIHLLEPEIIKIDVENFSRLVQRLTGKHPAHAQNNTITYTTTRSGGELKSSSSSSSREWKTTTLPTTVKVKGELEEHVYDGEEIPDEFLSFLQDPEGDYSSWINMLSVNYF